MADAIILHEILILNCNNFHGECSQLAVVQMSEVLFTEGIQRSVV